MNVKIMLADGEFPQLQVGDCTVVTETQLPGFGVAPFVVLETHDAYPEGLTAGPYNEAHAGSPGDLERAALLKQLIRLRKECATCCLQLMQRAMFVDDNAAIADLERGKTDPHVLELVKLGQSFPLDTCRSCGRPAPCNDDGMCCWGCPA